MSVDMSSGINIGMNTLIEIVPQLILLTIFFANLASRIKSSQEMSDYKFLINAQRIENMEKELGVKITANDQRVDALNAKYDSLNREVLNKLSEIEKLLARLQGQFHLFDNQSKGG